MHSGIGMTLVSLEGQFLDVNPTLCKFLGYSETELLEYDFQALTHPDDLRRDVENLKSLLAGEIETYSLEKRYRHKAGYYLWGMLTVSLVNGEDGRPMFFLSQIQDVTEAREHAEMLARARDAAERADQAKSRFLAMMSHEIRTPMNAVLGFTSLLRSTPLNDEQKDFLEIIESSGERLLGLINDVLDFSKIESGTITVKPAPMDVRDCVSEVFRLLKPTVSAKGLQYDLVVHREVPVGILSDRSRLTQILINILGNAVKFTDAGTVTFRVEAVPWEGRNWQWKFRVTDSGPGIASGMEEKIFQIFVQGDDGLARSHGGSGLGLAISQRLAALLDGEIKVGNVPGGGAEFCVCLIAPAIEHLEEADGRTEIRGT